MPGSNRDERCQIWTDYPGSRDGSPVRGETGDFIFFASSPRAGGKYGITDTARIVIQGRDVDDSQKARLTTMLVDQRELGIERPVVTIDLIDRAKRTAHLPVHERADRLLRFMALQTQKIGDPLFIAPGHGAPCKLDPGAMAWTESVSLEEVRYLLKYLTSRGWVRKDNLDMGLDMGQYEVTIDGYGHISNLEANTDSSQSFIAMWFDDSMAECYEKGIEPAVRDAGYNPLRIDRKEHVNKIDDEIVAEIRRSRFLVADFTQGDDGARGGVYYEAGFAQGLGLSVIFTCRQDCVGKLHFDTNHYNHIVWETPEELREKLKIRILAVIGEGPGVNRSPSSP